MTRRVVRLRLFNFVRARYVMRATVATTVAAMVLSTADASAAWAATTDWNLGNTSASQVADLTAPATGVVRNDGLKTCLERVSGATANGTVAASSTCTGASGQMWTFKPPTFSTQGNLTPAGVPTSCLSVVSRNGGPAREVAAAGAAQMLLTDDGQVWARTQNGLNAELGPWVKETDAKVQDIAGGSDGTQMIIGADWHVYARNNVGADGWTNEGTQAATAIATNGGTQLYLASDGTVYARSGIGDATGWVAETAAGGAKAIAVGSDGTQMMIGADGSVYARSAIGNASGWVKELGPGAQAIATNGGLQMLVDARSEVYVKTGISLNGWTKEAVTSASGAAVTAPASPLRRVITVDSDRTQMMQGSDGNAYARLASDTTWTVQNGPVLTGTDVVGRTAIAVGSSGRLIILNTGTVSARTAASRGRYVSASDPTADSADGVPVKLYDCHDWANQGWVFEYSKSGSIQLRNPASNRCLNTPNDSTTSGTALTIATCTGSLGQQFTNPTTPPPPSGPITNPVVNKCAVPASTTSTPDTGAAVVINPCGVGYTTGPVLPWTLNKDGTLTAGTMCLSLTGGETATTNGTKTTMSKCAGTLDQQWVVGFDTTGRTQLINPNSARCLEDPNANLTTGTPLQIATCNNGDAQVWSIPHTGHAFAGPITATTTVIPAGTGTERLVAMQTAARVRDTRAHLALLMHAGGPNVRQIAAQWLAGPDTALNVEWGDWVDKNWIAEDWVNGWKWADASSDTAPAGPLGADIVAAGTADQARQQRETARDAFLAGYPMGDYGSRPSFDTDVTNFLSKGSTRELAVEAAYFHPLITQASKAEQDKVWEIYERHLKSEPGNGYFTADNIKKVVEGSADDVRRFIQFDSYPRVAPQPNTPEFRIEVEALKTRWAQGDPSNPLDPDHVLLDVEETAWAEWQAELNSQAQPRADILAAEMQSLDALRASSETMHDGLGYAWTARGIQWAQDQKFNSGKPAWTGVDISRAPHDLGVIKAKVAALAAAAKNSAAVAKDAADKAVAARDAAYTTATAAGLPQGRGLTYAQQSAQVAQAAAAATQATANAMQTVVAAVNATLANSATLLANASAQAHAARALYLRQSAEDSAAHAAQLAAQAKQEEKEAATAAAKAAADKTKIATVEADAKSALARADAAAADAAKQEKIAADAQATAERERQNAAAAMTAAQNQAAIAESKKNEAASAAAKAGQDETAAKLAETFAMDAWRRAAKAQAEMVATAQAAAEADAKAAAAAGTDAADDAEAQAVKARKAADDAAAAADTAGTEADAAQAAASRARSAAGTARAAAQRAAADLETAKAAASQTHADAVEGHALAADAISNARYAASQAAQARKAAADAKAEADSAKAAAQQAQTEAADALADSAVAIGQAVATGQAAQETAVAAATVAAPADTAIDLATPWAATDSAAGLAGLSSQAAETISAAQANIAAAQATQAAALAVDAQDAANRASGDAKLALQAAAAAAVSASQAAASAAAATKSANQAAADAKATKQASARIDEMDAKAQQDVTKTQGSADAADAHATAAEAAADESERDADAAHHAYYSAQDSANEASEYADDAEASAQAAREAAENANTSLEGAQAAGAALASATVNDPQQLTDLNAKASPLGDGIWVRPEAKVTFTPDGPCVGVGGCDVTGTAHVTGYNVYFYAACAVPDPADPNHCFTTASGSVLNLYPLATIPINQPPYKITHHIDQMALYDTYVKHLPETLFHEFIGCYHKLTSADDGGSLFDCGLVVGELFGAEIIKAASTALRALRIAMIAYDVEGIDGAINAIKALKIEYQTLIELQKIAAAARAEALEKRILECLGGHSFAEGTGVLMADGTVKPIEAVRVGDLVRNATPSGGVETHQVTQTHRTTTDTEFTELTVVAGDRRVNIVGTQNHPFYDVTRAEFVNAGDLAVGDQLRTGSSGTITVAAVRNYTGAMATYDLTIEGLHTYFVDNNGLPVLVHNSTACPPGWVADALREMTDRKLPVTTGFLYVGGRRVAELSARTEEESKYINAYLHKIFPNVPAKTTFRASWHADGKLAWWMRLEYRNSGFTSEELKNGIMIINNKNGPCGGVKYDLGCLQDMANILYRDQKISVFWPGRAEPYPVQGVASR
ncbi:Pierisin [Actinoplanes sp. SE50]|uniref:ricin-type beta-trefoil lectin domain protein n=1 Tax=unclassified Actinoplanes TaxID=2626549 RepID=UPI00023EBC87|nr:MULTISPECIES: ricin-type beta-trefoil lectin domain protein [unclassified Actinoplanes]AEV81239.1 Pierisin [Actinoplanes sp. SE50/110]ATO79642.1 Pierisin [Actinoplanes sp. SE50]SLL97045.1 hypothetical protein ACSP50_0241 [Actinoplanes sp. SE50/110]